MSNGLYTAFTGMRARQRALDTIANNIANASTSGFKADAARYGSVEAEQQQQAGDAAQAPSARRVQGAVVDSATSFRTGAFTETGRPLDLALEGDGFFVVQTPAGERYTRAGSFTLDAAGQLVTQNGDLVVGSRGPVTLPPGEASIAEDGTISVGGQVVDSLRVVRFGDPRAALLKEGSSLFVATGAQKPAEAAGGVRVVQGALESSNVDIVSEMATMMQTNREFESLQKSVSLMMNDLGRKVSNEIGRL